MEGGKTYRILVVDDSATVRQLIRMVLQKDPTLRLDEAKDGAEALEKVGAGSYDLVLTDVNMPRLDGLGLIGAIRTQLRSTVPIVVVTTRGAEADRDRGLALGADSYLTKPIDGTALLRVVEGTLGRQS